ncbi:unnamed protein product [Clonostachys rosea f. rosea IK726]|uniref:Uncharacterized protein n=1 Tax=Clonostachys rosea f. rosea IK726 TaxID=1349383 RepID=A0ACA9TZ80_BIOOC|nr:unnamed protein product [Clonostachys rosea f. rosea IK726]
MAYILNLPISILEQIAETCTWGCDPTSDSLPASYARNHAALARTCRDLYEVLNEGLYKRNLKRDPHRASCVQWAAWNGRLDTMKRAVEYGADLSSNGVSDQEKDSFDWHSNDGHITALFAAIRLENRDIFDYLMAQRVDFNVPCQGCPCGSAAGGCYPIHLGFQEYRPDVKENAHPYVEALIKKGARHFSKAIRLQPVDLVRSGYDQVTVLEALKEAVEPERTKAFYCAVGAGLYDLARAILLKYPNFDLSKPISDSLPFSGAGMTIIHHLVMSMKNDFGFLELLLDRPELEANMELEDGNNLLLLAMLSGSVETARILTSRPEFEYKANKAGTTPLHRAVIRGKEMADLIMNLPGVDVSAVTNRGETVLHCALEHQREIKSLEIEEELPQVVQMLLDHPDIDPLAVTSEGETALQYACGHKRSDLALMLLKDPRIKEAPTQVGLGHLNLLFTVAIEEGSPEVLQALLDTRPEIDIDAQDEKGNTTLHAACSRNGVIPSKKIGDKFFPYRIKENHMEDLVQVLVKGGASIDLVDCLGQTPVRRALNHGQFRIAAWMISEGAEPPAAGSMLDAAFLRYRERASFAMYIEVVKELAAHRIAVKVIDDLPPTELAWLVQDMKTLDFYFNGIPDLGLPEAPGSQGALPVGYYLDGFEELETRLKPEWVIYMIQYGARLEIPVTYPNGDSESLLAAYFRAIGVGNVEMEMDPDKLRLFVEPLVNMGYACGPVGNLPSALEIACQTDIGGEKKLLQIMVTGMRKNNVDRQHVRYLISEYDGDDEVLFYLRRFEQLEFGDEAGESDSAEEADGDDFSEEDDEWEDSVDGGD